MSLFKKGYNAVREEKERQEVNRENMSKRLMRFFLTKDGEEAKIRFLTEEPITFYEHNIKSNGGKFSNVVCTNDDCPLCANGGDRPSFKGAYLVYDYRSYEYTDRNGKKQKIEGQIRLYVAGTRVLSQLDRLSNRYGLTNRDYTISRSGSGTSTTYMFEREEQNKLSTEQIKNWLPEKLAEDFNGSQDSLESIVEKQLEYYLPNENTKADNDEDEEADTTYSTRKNLINAEEDEEDEEEEVRKPVKDEEPKKAKVSIKSLKHR